MSEHGYEMNVHIKYDEEIENNSGIAGDYSTDPNSDEVKRRLKNVKKGKEDGEGNATSIKKIAGVSIVTATTTKAVDNAITQKLTTVSQRTGRNEYGARASETYSTIKSTTTSVAGIVGATAVNPILGAITLGATVIDKLISLSNSFKQQQLAQQKESITQGISIIRSGNMNTRGTS